MPDSDTSRPAPAAAAALPPGSRRALAPFRHRVYRAIWVGTLFSNLGVWMQSVGAAWLMTLIAGSPDLVAMVQSASSLPMLLFAIVGGVLADVLDRRLVQVLGQGIVLVAALLLALSDGLGLVTPWLLLSLTFVLGVGSAIRQPAFQSSVGELVPPEDVPAAVALNSVNFNIARSIGPGIGGLIVAAAGAKTAFLVNAVCNLIAIAVLLRWRGQIRSEPHARESVLGALTAGLRETLRIRALRRVMIRVWFFCLFASALWALMPLIARHDMGGTPFTYGLMLGALGVGAVIAAGLLPWMRRSLTTEATIELGTVLFAVATLALATVHVLPLLLPLLLIGGVAWMTVMSTFSITIQLEAPGWVKARVLAMYFTFMFGSLALGSWFWGLVAAERSVAESLLGGTGMLIASLALRWPARMAESRR